ncbi:MAG TPA: putative 2OG-Fe(II) oxygenase [Steroidobacteraceae bacterium]|nr:putative 2OG-Fe(II) oxygenase [Steroidobacteraceae bacterium]
MSAPTSRVIGLFPTPLLHAPGVVPEHTVALLRGQFLEAARKANGRSARLSHTQILRQGEDPLLSELSTRLLPSVTEFGELIFGEQLEWCIKEMWGNVLQAGGQQSLHNHANSFISGVVYLTRPHRDASLTFARGIGHPGFVFSNAHAGSLQGPFNADKWIMPAVQPGDLVLFPSHLLHEVPQNPGPDRVSLAFNAIPGRLDAWGYQISLRP